MKLKRFFHILFPIVLMLVTGPILCGCALLLIGGGAAGGYAVSKDQIEGAVDARYDKVYSSALESARSKGIVKLEDQSRGYIETMVDSNTVKIHVTRITDKAVKLKVEARNKFKMPKIEIAQDIYTDIMRKAG
ncbi:MAG: DUF3568 family protein [Candidatus Omnitrophica bacterium]|nr:DUF3568 family protein [Candidatus Omnitrophota bacterium]